MCKRKRSLQPLAASKSAPGATPPSDDEFARGGAKAGSKLDYPQLYCEFVEKIELRADVSEELPAICKDGAPTQLMLDYRNAS